MKQNIKTVWRNLGKNRGYFFLTLTVGILFSGISVLTPMLSGSMVTAFTEGTVAGSRFLILYAAVGLCQILFSLLDVSLGMHFKLRQKQLMRNGAFRAFSRKDSASRESAAAFESYVNNDIPALADQYFSGTIDIVKCIFILALSAVSMLSVHWVLAVLVFAISGLILLCPKAVRKEGGEARAAYSAALGRYNTGLQSFLDGLRVVKSYGYYDRVNAIQEESNLEIAKKEKGIIRCQMTVQSLASFLQVGKTVLILILGIVLISMGEMKIGGLVAVVQLAEMIAAPTEVLAYLIHARNEVLPLLCSYEEMTEEETAGKEGEKDRHPLHERIRTLAVENVVYETEEHRILDGISVAFQAGKKYLISGESGSGKTTLLRLIAQIGDLSYSGKITCNGEDVRKITEEDYYKKICPVFQEPYLFYATLEENILLGRAISEEVYKDVIQKLNLGYLVDRYHGEELTPEVMEKLSGGERQRVALARAMVGKPEVYLLDEVTSALDAQTSGKIEEVLLQEDACIIHICHKANPRMLPRYDARFVMSGKLLPTV